METPPEPIDFTTGVPRAGDLDVAWIHGSESAKHNTDPDIQVHAYDEHTFILRQNMAVNYEAPFMFLLFGNDRAVLIDTGATASADFFPLRRIVDSLMEAWLAAHPRDGYQLLVLHTHPHGDHVAGDAQFAGRPEHRPGGRRQGQRVGVLRIQRRFRRLWRRGDLATSTAPLSRRRWIWAAVSWSAGPARAITRRL